MPTAGSIADISNKINDMTNNEDTDYEFDAFISYRHEPKDKAAAEKLHKLLEGYKAPRLSGVTRKRMHIYRDENEIKASPDLDNEIITALRKSRFLIVICSDNLKNSVWCAKEIEYFKSLHGARSTNILTLLISGHLKEVIPYALYHDAVNTVMENGEMTKEIIDIEPCVTNISAANDKKMLKLLSSEFLRIEASLLGCSYDDLFRRHQRRLIRYIIQIFSVIAVLTVSVSMYVIYSQNIINEKELSLMEQKLLTVERDAYAHEQELLAQTEKTMRTLDAIQDLIDTGDKVLASTLAVDLADNTDVKSEYINYEITKMLNRSVYVPKYSQYTKLNQNEQINYADFSENGDYFFTATEAGTITMWKTKNGSIYRQWRADEPIAAICVENGLLYAVTKENNLYIWDIDTNALIKSTPFEVDFLKRLWSEYLSGNVFVVKETMIVGAMLFLRLNSDVVIIDLDSGNDDAPLTSEWISSIHNIFLDKQRSRFAAQYNDNSFVLDLDSGDEHILPPEPDTVFCCYNHKDGSIISVTQKKDIDYYVFGIKTHNVTSGETNEFELTLDSLLPIYILNSTTIVGALSAHGNYLAVGDGFGNIYTIDLINESVHSHIKTPFLDGKRYRITFIDSDYLCITYIDGESQAELYKYSDTDRHYLSPCEMTLPNTAARDICIVAPDNSVMAMVNSMGVVNMYSLKGDLAEREILMEDAEIYDGFSNADNRVEERGYSVVAVSGDGRYTLASRGRPLEYCMSYRDEDMSVQGITLPDGWMQVSVKDGDNLTLLTESFYIYDYCISSREVSNRIKPDSILSGYRPYDFRMDYENDVILLTAYRFVTNSKLELIGVALERKTGKLIFEFSDQMKDSKIGFDINASRVYKYKDDSPWAVERALEFNMSKLIDMAHKQIDGRRINAGGDELYPF